jgi:8-oxo-dGTP pyrophosphatase MutT (NUDIX family)
MHLAAPRRARSVGLLRIRFGTALSCPQVIVPPVSDSAPVTPRPAATVILLRRSGRHRRHGLEVLMVERGPGQAFMPGVWVFPGGVIEPDEDAPQCARRELREETGIELAEDADLHPWMRWITPVVVPVRFDTQFFVALAPPHAPPRPDGEEVSDADWLRPFDALDRNAAGMLKLVFPTIKTLETLLPYASADEVIEAAASRDPKPILPRVVGTRESHRILLPGDPGYDDQASPGPGQD